MTDFPRPCHKPILPTLHECSEIIHINEQLHDFFIQWNEWQSDSCLLMDQILRFEIFCLVISCFILTFCSHVSRSSFHFLHLSDFLPFLLLTYCVFKSLPTAFSLSVSPFPFYPLCVSYFSLWVSSCSVISAFSCCKACSGYLPACVSLFRCPLGKPNTK